MVDSQKDKVAIINEISKALDDMVFGSVELYVQNSKVTQITVRHIRKTNVLAKSESKKSESSKNEKKLLTNRKNVNILANVD
ncbi:MAG: DUF2292 domain-containing protein [Candidatus Levybacteria bacterium]|nr:DUF2292 domain-containing protein [Candidatus Levybacteria bacterium]